MSRQRNRQRTVIYLRPENYLYVMAKLTPQDGTKPAFGIVSDYFDALVDAARNRDAVAANGEQQ